jgi:ABC-type multidrug transport system ATPase subunit
MAVPPSDVRGTETNVNDAASQSTAVAEKTADSEMGHVATRHLVNDLIQNYAWKDINVKVKDRVTSEPLSILSDANGIVHGGEMIAIMGPSGSGKTTLLNAIAHRVAAAKATTTGERLANGQPTYLHKLRDLSSYVEQDDALIGSLTVRETVEFAAGLSLPR